MDTRPDQRLKKIQALWEKEATCTQQIAADEFNISQSAFNQYLRGIIPLNTDTIIKFSRFFNVPVSSIDPTLKF